MRAVRCNCPPGGLLGLRIALKSLQNNDQFVPNAGRKSRIGLQKLLERPGTVRVARKMDNCDFAAIRLIHAGLELMTIDPTPPPSTWWPDNWPKLAPMALE